MAQTSLHGWRVSVLKEFGKEPFDVSGKQVNCFVVYGGWSGKSTGFCYANFEKFRAYQAAPPFGK